MTTTSRTQYGAFVALLLMTVAGCSAEAGEPGTPEMVATRGEALTGPFTISLAAPSTLAANAPVLEGFNGVTLNSSSTVAGTIAAMGTSGFGAGVSTTIDGDAWSRGTAHLSSNMNLTGTLHATSAVTTIGDRIGGRDTNPLFDPTNTESWSVTWPTGMATDVSVPQTQTQTIAPGLYGTVAVNSNGTLNLAAGTYYITTLTAQPQSRISVAGATGPVIVYVSTSATLRGSFSGVTTTADLLVGYFGTTNIAVGDVNCTLVSGTCLPFVGSIIATSSTLTLQAISSGPHQGFFAAPNIVIASQAKVEYRAPTFF